MGQKPQPPNYADLQKQGFQLQYKYAPKFAQEALQLNRRFGPQTYAQQLQALQQIDPTGYAARQALGQGTLGQYLLGTQQDPATLRQEQQYIRGAQAARGNAFGNAPVAAEALYQGQRGQQLQQYRTAALGSFLAGRTPEQDIMAIQSPSQYVNPQAGAQAAQFGLQNYPNQYAYGSQMNPWASALGTIGSAVGSYYGGPIGGAAGGYTSGLIGQSIFGSDPKMKTDVQKVGTVPIYQYKYKPRYGIPGTFRGPMSTDVKKLDPGAVVNVFGHDYVRSPNSLGLNRVKVKEE